MMSKANKFDLKFSIKNDNKIIDIILFDLNKI